MKLHTGCLKKKAYYTIELAEKVARRCEVERPGTQLRTYWCNICGNFHLTSQKEEPKSCAI